MWACFYRKGESIKPGALQASVHVLGTFYRHPTSCESYLQFKKGKLCGEFQTH